MCSARLWEHLHFCLCICLSAFFCLTALQSHRIIWVWSSQPNICVGTGVPFLPGTGHFLEAHPPLLPWQSWCFCLPGCPTSVHCYPHLASALQLLSKYEWVSQVLSRNTPSLFLLLNTAELWIWLCFSVWICSETLLSCLNWKRFVFRIYFGVFSFIFGLLSI